MALPRIHSIAFVDLGFLAYNFSSTGHQSRYGVNPPPRRCRRCCRWLGAAVHSAAHAVPGLPAWPPRRQPMPWQSSAPHPAGHASGGGRLVVRWQPCRIAHCQVDGSPVQLRAVPRLGRQQVVEGLPGKREMRQRGREGWQRRGGHVGRAWDTGQPRTSRQGSAASALPTWSTSGAGQHDCCASVRMWPTSLRARSTPKPVCNGRWQQGGAAHQSGLAHKVTGDPWQVLAALGSSCLERAAPSTQHPTASAPLWSSRPPRCAARSPAEWGT